MTGEITRSGLIDLLKTLIDQGRTATVYVHTDDNHLIAVGVEGREIVSLLCGPRQGERAIPMIRRMRSGTFRLDDGARPHRRPGARLPPADALLALLGEEEDDEAPQSGSRWVQDVLCKVLAGYMGPIAPLVCRQTVEAAGGLGSDAQVREVVESLAGEIEDAAEAERFRSDARRELGRLLD